MKIIIFGALCMLQLWRAGALARGVDDGYLSADHLRTLRSYEPNFKEEQQEYYGKQTEGSEFVSKSIDSGAGGELDYVGLLVDTSPVKQQALAQAGATGPPGRPGAQLPFFAPPPPPYAGYPPRRGPPTGPPRGMAAGAGPVEPQLPFFAPPPPPYAEYPPRRGPPIGPPGGMPMGMPRGAPRGTAGGAGPVEPMDMFKLVAYLTKDGQITNGRLMSVHDMVHGRPHIPGHQYISGRPGGMALNRPGSRPHGPYAPFPPQDPYAVHHPGGATLHRPGMPPLAMAHNPHAWPGVAVPPGYGARPRPLHPQQGRLSDPELNSVVDNIVSTSVGPNGEQLSPELVGDIVNLLNGEMLTELAEALMNDNPATAAAATGTSPAPAGDPVNAQAFAQLQQLISDQIRDKMDPILQQVPMPTA